MAVAGINNVSVLESSYFGDNYSPVMRTCGNQDKPITRTSFIRKLWRDLEDGSKIKQSERKQITEISNTNIRSQCSCSSEASESENMSVITSEAENECPLDHNQIAIQNELENNNNNYNLCSQQSPAIGVVDKERVRQVFREWGNKNINNNNNACELIGSHGNNCLQVRSVCENESKRVSTVRRWLESNSQQAEAGQSCIEEQDGSSVNQTCVSAKKSIRFLYGRHALRDLLTRFEMERKKEMQSLLESRPVSTFAHRKRIQTLLKGTFLWNQRFIQDEKSTSNAASELGLLRQSQTVSDLRKGFLSKVNSYEKSYDGPHSDTSSENGIKYQEHQVRVDSVNQSDTLSENDINHQENHQLEDTKVKESESEGPQLSPPNEIFENMDHEDDGSVNTNHGQHQTEPLQQFLEIKSQYESGGDDLEVDESFEHLNPSETETDILSWQEETVEAEDSLTIFESNSIQNQNEYMYHETVHDGWYDHHHPVITSDTFYTHDDNDDDNDENNDDNNDYDDDGSIIVDLQRLRNRRRVSNLLQSDFSVRLDRLLQSYVARQDQASESDEDWMLDTDHQDPYQQTVDENENDEANESAELADDSWQHLPEINQHEWEIINGLRMHMVMLQERINIMQNTLETCMKMQHELHRSVQQEVSSALNRSSNSGKETCFLCCDSGSDSSPNRGGHVYVCSNCAEKINWSKIKESVMHP